MKTKVKKRLFVSRDLGEDSPFLNLKIDFEIIGHSMLDIEPIELTFIPLAHWYVFYSKNAIQAFELNMKKLNFNFPSGSRFICMGRSSEKKLYDVLGQKASIIVESLDPKYEDKIKEEIRHGHVCFVSAKESTRDSKIYFLNLKKRFVRSMNPFLEKIFPSLRPIFTFLQALKILTISSRKTK